MTKPILSKEFTVDDIHKLREYNYEVTKDMTVDERVEYINKKGEEAIRKLGLILAFS